MQEFTQPPYQVENRDVHEKSAMMSVYKIILERRSIRRFKQLPIPLKKLAKIVNAARLAPSSANLQPCEYLVVNDRMLTDAVFGMLKWAGYIAPAGNPPQGEKPTTYIVVLVNSQIRKNNYQWDAGAGIENMILTAWEEGIVYKVSELRNLRDNRAGLDKVDLLGSKSITPSPASPMESPMESDTLCRPHTESSDRYSGLIRSHRTSPSGGEDKKTELKGTVLFNFNFSKNQKVDP